MHCPMEIVISLVSIHNRSKCQFCQDIVAHYHLGLSLVECLSWKWSASPGMIVWWYPNLCVTALVLIPFLRQWLDVQHIVAFSTKLWVVLPLAFCKLHFIPHVCTIKMMSIFPLCWFQFLVFERLDLWCVHGIVQTITFTWPWSSIVSMLHSEIQD